MKIWVEDKDGNCWPAELPFENANHVQTELTCAKCGEKNAKVAGRNNHIESHDTYAADAHHNTVGCMARIGTIRVRVSTIFGLEEDEAVLIHGRARVYG